MAEDNCLEAMQLVPSGFGDSSKRLSLAANRSDSLANNPDNLENYQRILDFAEANKWVAPKHNLEWNQCWAKDFREERASSIHLPTPGEDLGEQSDHGQRKHRLGQLATCVVLLPAGH